MITKAIQCGDFSNICRVHHMLFAIISTNSCAYLYHSSNICYFSRCWNLNINNTPQVVPMQYYTAKINNECIG